MRYTETLLDDIRSQIEPDDVVVKEAKDRRRLVQDAATSYGHTRQTFPSGSLAHGTAICPIHRRDKGLDADCAVVLDPAKWPYLGPETSANEPPDATVEPFRAHVERHIRRNGYPKAKVTVTKRAVLVEFKAPLPEGEDPSVDLIVALPRTPNGVWIPNTEQHRWDPSDPERHTELFLGPDSAKDLRVMRARVVRLAKAENKRTDPPALCSFNIEALAIMFLTEVLPLDFALRRLWAAGADDLSRRLTPDPAWVSGPIKVKDRLAASARWHDNAVRLTKAINGSAYPESVRETLQPLWPDYVPDSGGGSRAREQASYASALRAGRPVYAAPAGGLSLAATGAAIKQPRSFGSD